jgi:hemoglobin
MANRNRRLAGTFMLIAFGVSAIASDQTSQTLYARLGGTPVVSAFVADAIDRVVANPETNRTLDKANLQLMKDLLTERICTLTGGGCTHSGDRMREVHASHHLSGVEFSGLVEAMRESMRARGVPLAARNQLLEILAPMNRDVVKL